MLAKCGGLPLAIIVLGELLATKYNVKEWEQVRDEMVYQKRENESCLNEVLNLSYEDLSYELKPCFLHLSAERVIFTDHGDEKLEDIVECYLANLISRSMVQVGQIGSTGNIKTCRLHTSMRKFCTVNWLSNVEIPNVLWKLKRLRHLYLPRWCWNQDNTLQLDTLINLHTLVNFPANLCSMNNLFKLKKLRKLVLNDPRYFQQFCNYFDTSNDNGRLDSLISLSLKSDLNSLSNVVVDVEKLVLGCPSLHKLKVEGRVEKLPAASLFPSELAKLTLWGSKLVEDPMATLEKLPKLRYLNGWEMFVGKRMICSQEGFPQLRYLELRSILTWRSG